MKFRRWFSLCLSPFAICLIDSVAHALVVSPAITGGIMQQPTSNYYLACYGASVDVESSFIVRASYAERPEFNRNGFAEKDRIALLTVGTTASKILGGTLNVFFGGGSASGYVSKVSTDGKTTLDKRSYSLPGPAASAEYMLRFGKSFFALNHTTFIGYGGRDQTESLVAWPYNFYFFSTGYSF